MYLHHSLNRENVFVRSPRIHRRDPRPQRETDQRDLAARRKKESTVSKGDSQGAVALQTSENCGLTVVDQRLRKVNKLQKRGSEALKQKTSESLRRHHIRAHHQDSSRPLTQTRSRHTFLLRSGVTIETLTSLHNQPLESAARGVSRSCFNFENHVCGASAEMEKNQTADVKRSRWCWKRTS